MLTSFIYLFNCVLVFFSVLNESSTHYNYGRDRSCGVDKSSIPVVYEGVAKIETYPWMGYLFYSTNTKRYITSVVLITRQMALGTALEIDKLPKDDFRARARAVFGCNCSGPSVPVRDYNYHPDYEKNSYSALAMVQLETDYSTVVLHPICPPPNHFLDPQIYAIALSDNCNKPTVKLYEMEYVNTDECKVYYRKFGLDTKSMWPTNTICTKAVSGGECVWKSGAVLALWQGERWRLLGFGVHGPGCGAPSRFLDYGAYHKWVRRNIVDIGKPTISRVGPNVVVLRRSLSNLQRYGPCDYEETKYEIYTDHTEVITPSINWRKVRYNVSLYAGVEYSCVVFRVDNFMKHDKEPRLYLRRWCAGAINTCKDFQYIEIEFYVEIFYIYSITYDMKAYGRVAKAIDVNRAMKYINRNSEPTIFNFATLWLYMWRYDEYKKLAKQEYPEELNNLTIYYARLRWMNLRGPLMTPGQKRIMAYPVIAQFMRPFLWPDYKVPPPVYYIHGWDDNVPSPPRSGRRVSGHSDSEL